MLVADRTDHGPTPTVPGVENAAQIFVVLAILSLKEAVGLIDQ